MDLDENKGQVETRNAKLKKIEAIRLSADTDMPLLEECAVAVEQPVTISIDGLDDYTLMCTPSDLRALAVGFCFTEGIIRGINDIHLMHECEDNPNIVRLRVANSEANGRVRNLIVTSSCGLCGSRSLEAIPDLTSCGEGLVVSMAILQSVLHEMKCRQSTFQTTGGTHAAAIFLPDGRIVAFAEDIGRHNALDKAIGKCLLEGQETVGQGVALSGRVSLELVAKAAAAGLQLIAAVSAPSSLAVEAAEQCNMTLCGFVRQNRATIYSHPYRVSDAEGFENKQ